MTSAHAAARSPVNAWDEILTKLQKKVDTKSFETWFKPTVFKGLRGSALQVSVPSATYKDWIEAYYRETIDEAIREIGLSIRTVEFSTERTPEPGLPIPPQTTSVVTSATNAMRSFGAAAAAPAAVTVEDLPAYSPLNPKYTFTTFVVGSSNQFAHAAASRVASDPGQSYNPLFLYGGVGLGKTHLMHSIGHALLERFPSWRVVYISAERFTNEMVQSIKNDRMVTFHQTFRHVDALLVDDVQFLSGKERTQEEFFHTFNSLFERQRQIVLTSDRPPKEIAEIDERLRSRYASGLIADIQPPDLETRQAILMKMAEQQQLPVPEKVALFIATNVKSNIRELEGSLVRLVAYASLTGEEITEAMAREALKDVMGNDARRVSIELIQKTVCDMFGLRLQELKAKDNSKRVVVPRQVAMWLARELTESSLPEIARAFGDKHHTTVLHSINKIQQQRLEDKDLNRLLNKLLASLE